MAGGFKVTSVFADSAFKPLINWIRQELHVNLTTCAADLHVPRAKNAIRFIKEIVKCIQTEMLFTKYPKRLTIKMVKRVTVTVLINSFNRKSGVHAVISRRQMLFGKKFKTPLCAEIYRS